MATGSRAPVFERSRRSDETERRHLFAESIAPSDSASIATTTNEDAGDRTPRAGSPTRQSLGMQRHKSIAAPEQAVSERQAATTSYRGFASQEAYLEALQAWAEDKRFEQPSKTSLVGFYGATTMSEYASRPPPPGLDLMKRWKARKASKQADKLKPGNERRATVA